MTKRIFQGLILFFAIYAFVFVPLGKKTALGHIRAIIGTPAAREAASEVKGGVTRLVRRLESEARKSTEDTDRRLDSVDEEELEAETEEATSEAAEAPRAAPKPKLRALSAEKPARGGI